MIYALLADIVLVLHLAFIVYVLFGGLLVFQWPKTAWIHVPTAIYGVAIEAIGWVCPLTPLENEFRRLAGEAGYEGGFVDHYLIPIIYPAGLTPTLQWVLAAIVAGINLGIYGAYLVYGRSKSAGPDTG